MQSQTTQATPLPLVSASPVGSEEKADLEAMLGVDVTAEWSMIRQCLRCLTQGARIDARGDNLVVRPEPEAKRMTGREAVRAVVALAKSGKNPPLLAARLLAFTAAGLALRAEWDAWWAKVEADKAARRDAKPQE